MSRSILLPPYMSNPVWITLADSIDRLLSDVDATTKQLRTLRDPYVVGPMIVEAINTNALFDTESSEYQKDQQLLLKQLSFIGLPLTDPSFLNLTQLLMLFRHTGHYWYSKGTGAIIDFLNYTLGASLVMKNMWTDDYVRFAEEGDILIVNKIVSPTQGPVTSGIWYPTTHVSLDIGEKNSVFSTLGTQQLLQLFNDIFNYNLVLYSINRESTIVIPDVEVNMSLFVDKTFYISDVVPLEF